MIGFLGLCHLLAMFGRDRLPFWGSRHFGGIGFIRRGIRSRPLCRSSPGIMPVIYNLRQNRAVCPADQRMNPDYFPSSKSRGFGRRLLVKEVCFVGRALLCGFIGASFHRFGGGLEVCLK